MGQAIVIKGADYSAKNLGKVILPYQPSSEATIFLNEIGEYTGSSKGQIISLFFDGLLNSGLYSKIQAGYMFYGPTSQAVNTNFKTPDQKAGFTQANVVLGGVYVGDNANVVTLLPNVIKSATGHICAYNKTAEMSSGINTILSSASSTTLNGLSLSRRAGSSFAPVGSAFSNLAIVATTGQNDKGSLMATFEEGKSKLFNQGFKIFEANDTPFSGSVGGLNMGLKSGSGINYSTKAIISYVSIGQGLTEAEVTLYDRLITDLVNGIHI